MDVETSQAGPDRSAPYKVVYDEAVRALAEQQATIDGVRGRAGYLLSAATITTSVLGAQALPRSSGPLAWIALAGFVGVTVMSLAVLRPRRSEISATPEDLIWNYIETDDPAPVHRLHRDLSVRIQTSYVQNLCELTSLTTLFQVASWLLIGEVVVWVLAIASSR